MFPELHLALKAEVQDKQPNRAERRRHRENPHVLMVGPGPQQRILEPSISAAMRSLFDLTSAFCTLG